MQRGPFFINCLVVGATVLILVVILVVSGGVEIGPRHAPRNQTKIILKALAAILGSYRTTTASIPPDIDGLVSAASAMPSLSKAIGAFPSGSVVRASGERYSVLDGYGNPILMVIASGDARSPYFQSAGPDGVLGTSDDMFSYDP